LYELSEEQLSQGLYLEKAQLAFEELKNQYVNTPILIHANPDEDFHILLYTTPWAISATLSQFRDGILHPIRFCGRVLKGGEPRYEPWAKEVLALLRILKICGFELGGRSLKVYTQFSVLSWVSSLKRTKSDYVEWSVLLTPWNIEYISIESDDEKLKLSALLATSMSPPHTVMEELGHLCPHKIESIAKPISISLPVFGMQEEAYVATFDGGVKSVERVGSFGVVIWKLPEWKILTAFNGVVSDATVNTAEYHGCIAALQWAVDNQIVKFHVFGDSRIVIHQLCNLIQCKQPHLQDLMHRAHAIAKCIPEVFYHHVKRQ
jgi:ribonuclease HI